MASATSFALPRPQAPLPARSPVTIKALKLKRRPPFTTLEQRLMKTTFSVNPSFDSLGALLRSSRRLGRSFAICFVSLRWK